MLYQLKMVCIKDFSITSDVDFINNISEKNIWSSIEYRVIFNVSENTTSGNRVGKLIMNNGMNDINLTVKSNIRSR